VTELADFPEDERQLLLAAQARANARRAAQPPSPERVHLPAPHAPPSRPAAPAERWKPPSLPCHRCKQTVTLMGAFCEPCDVAEKHERKVQRVHQATRKLAKHLEPWLQAGEAELRRRVHAPRLLAFADKWQPGRGSLALLGPSGVGKTTAEILCANRLRIEAINAGDDTRPITRAMWVTGIELALDGRESRFGSRDETLHAAMRAPLLFIDEIGQERSDPRWLLELMDERYFNNRPTISSSGLQRAELESRYGAGAVRRLTEPGGVLIDLFGGTA
jgi:DNA replication protein DnaC